MTETNFRALCEELMNEAIYLGAIPYDQAPNPELIAQARAALAQPEPAPTDEEAWQWYSYCPEDGIELHPGKELAQKAAQEIMGNYAKAAHSDGWHEDMDSVSWGILLPVEQAQVVECTEAEPDSEFDEWIRYELVPARWGTPAIQPGDGEIDEEAATVIPWLLENAARAADADQSYVAGKLTLAAQLLGERRPANNTSQED